MKFIRSLFFTSRFLTALFLIAFLFVLGYFFPLLLSIAQIFLLTIAALFIIDVLALYAGSKNKNGRKEKIFASREMAHRLSNGDLNEIKIFIENFYPFKVKIKLIDEIPFQFQKRDFEFSFFIEPDGKKILNYNLKPVKRGEYSFGNLNVYVSSPILFIARRFKFDNGRVIPVYPSFIQMKKYKLLAFSDRLTEAGIKRIRHLGHSTEFEQIKKYVSGDDYRTINWKATARKTELMVNHYEDEKSQQVYCIIDTGRVMKMPFEEMSLLDYAINSSLVISSIAIDKQDKAGLITFSNKVGSILPADRQSSQILKILDALYKVKTDFQESDYEILYSTVLRKIKQRSLILLFTNFETLSALKRQILYLRKLAAKHLVVVIFFENTELKKIIDDKANDVEQIYFQTIAEKFAFEKKQIMRELKRYEIQSILSSPSKLSVNTINKYLELKARGLI